MVYYSAQTKGYCTPWSPSSSWLQHCRFPGPPGPSWGLGWANVTAPEGPRLMARKWPDNSAEACLSRVPARGSKDIPMASSSGYLGLFYLEPFSNFSKGVLTLSTLGPGL